MGEAAPIRDATTILLVRPGDRGVEVFMVQRSRASSFMASAYVYPGGALDPADGDPSLIGHVSGQTPQRCGELLAQSDPRKALATYVAGIRESFEEAGVLVAYRRTDPRRASITWDDAEDIDRMAAWRRRLHDGDATMAELVAAEDLVLPLDRLHPFAHWVTPAFERKRFDTWFFVVEAPEQHAEHDALETVASTWITARDALEAHARGRMHLFPPTFRTLERVAAHPDVDSLLASVEGATIPRIEPHFEHIDGRAVAILPGDPSYPDPNAVPVVGSTRIALDDGRWRSL